MTKKKKPFISIVVTSYNYGKYISKTLQSIVEQTYSDFECIVVDDGSTDNSLEIIKEYAAKDSRIKIYQHENGANKQLAASVELGVSKASGEYISFCESDDYWSPTHLEEKVKYLRKYPQTDIVVNMPKIFGEEVDYKYEVFKQLFNILKKIKRPQTLYFRLLKANGIVFPTFSVVMVRSSCLKKCHFDPILYKSAIDIWLWRQLLVRSKVGFINEELTFWRIHRSSLSHRDIQYDWNTFFAELEKYLNFSYKQKGYIKFMNFSQKIKPLYEQAEQRFKKLFFQRKVTKSGGVIVKVLKVPVYWKRRL